jgi:hypothetical protein
MTLDQQPLFEMPAQTQTRWASPENWRGDRGAGGKLGGGRKGSPCFALPAGESQVLAHVEQSTGVLRRIWCSFNDRRPEMLRSLRLRMYWDGAARPAVDAPLGDFFGVGLGQTAEFESALFSNPQGRSFNASVPMPFKTGMRVEVCNESALDLEMFFYDINYTVGDPIRDSSLYFHAHWRRENPTRMLRDYEILPRVAGAGRYLGTNIGVIVDTETYQRTWWGEGEVKIYLDGDQSLPTLAGTGTEDYIGTAWGQGKYAAAYQGSPIADHERYQYAFYRYHIPDPVYFRQDVRVTIQQIGVYSPKRIQGLIDAGVQLVRGPQAEPIDLQAAAALGEWGLFERQDDWSSCAYFYLNVPENDLPDLQPVGERTAGLSETTSFADETEV